MAHEIFRRHTDLTEPLSLDEALSRCDREQDGLVDANTAGILSFI